MSLLLPQLADATYYRQGQALVKSAYAKPKPSYAMGGKLYLSKSGWLLLSVPNALVRGVFDALDEPGVELPPYDNKPQQLNAHITVMRPEELEEIGGADKVTERGHTFHYNIGRVKTIEPAGWPEMSKCWMLHAISPELMKMRRSYGLTPLPERNGNRMPFHVTVAVRRRKVLNENEVSKVSSADSIDVNGKDDDLVYVKHDGKLVDSGDAGSYYVMSRDKWREQYGTEKEASDDTSLNAKLDKAIADIETDPSEAQKKSGNYRKGHVRLHGLAITIENGRGHTRSGTSEDGSTWSTKMKDHYGYIKQTESEADGDHIDVFIGPNPSSELIFVVNQVDPGGKHAFDEHKCILGAVEESQAREIYLRNYEDGWKGLGSIFPITLPQFKWWIEWGDTKKEIEDGMFAKHRRKAATVIDPRRVRDAIDRYAGAATGIHGGVLCLRDSGDTHVLSGRNGNGTKAAAWKQRTRVEDYEVCDSCGEEIHEKGSFYDMKEGKWYHRQCGGLSTKEAGAEEAIVRGIRAVISKWSPADPGYGYIYYDMDGDKAHIVSGDSDDGEVTDKWIKDLKKFGIKDVTCDAEYTPKECEDWIHIKRAADDTPHIPTLAVDLDGTLATHYDDFDADSIPKPRPNARKWMRRFQALGYRLIVFTVRGSTQLVKDWLHEHDIPYDYVNENPDQPPDSSGKVFADVYWDDRGVSAAGALDKSGPEVEKQLKKAATFTERALKAQVANPTWNPQKGLLSNLMTNAAQTQDRGREMVRHRYAARALEEHWNPALGTERLNRIFAGNPEPVITDPLDEVLLGEPAW